MSAIAQVLASQKIAAGGASLAVANAWKHISASGANAVTVAPSSGSLLFLCVSQAAGTSDTASSVSDNIGGSTGWVKIGTITNTNGVGIGLTLYYKANIPSGITSVTFTPSTGFTYTNVMIHEVTGASISAPFTSGEALFSTDSLGGTTQATSALTNSVAKSVFFACLTDSTGSNPGAATLNATGTTTTTWALKDSTNSQELNGSANWLASVAFLIVSTSAAQTHAWTIDAGTNVSKAIVCFS